MRDSIQISAVIPTYNRAHYIGRAIDSVLAQEHRPTEIIVVDDGSTDNTKQVVETYGVRVKYVYQPNAGVSAARNRGIEEARCEWIAFLDSDDCWLPSHLRRMADTIEATGGEAALYFADMRRARRNGTDCYWQLCGFKINGKFELRRDASEWALMRTHPMMLQASVIRRAGYLETGGLPASLRIREDTLLFFKLALSYPACAVSGCGTVMNSDDSIRLTHVYNAQSLVYRQASVALFKEALASLKHLNGDRRLFLTRGLSASYFGLGRLLARQRRYGSAIRNLLMSCMVRPSLFGKELFQSMVRHWFVSIRRSWKRVPAGTAIESEEITRNGPSDQPSHGISRYKY